MPRTLQEYPRSNAFEFGYTSLRGTKNSRSARTHSKLAFGIGVTGGWNFALVFENCWFRTHLPPSAGHSTDGILRMERYGGVQEIEHCRISETFLDYALHVRGGE